MKKITLAVALATSLTMPAYAQQQGADHTGHHPPQAKTSSVTLNDGEVRRIDRDAKKITLRHGPLQNLDMPAMTMVFQVKDPTMLDKISVGDKVKFNAEKVPGGYAVTTMELAK